MTTAALIVAEITTQVIALLRRLMGTANTVQFHNKFTNGFGNYPVERDELRGTPMFDQLAAEIKQERTCNAQESEAKRGLGQEFSFVMALCQ